MNKEMKYIRTLDWDVSENMFTAFRGHDGDAYIQIIIKDRDSNKSECHYVRVGSANSGAPEPPYVRLAALKLADAFERWEKEENERKTNLAGSKEDSGNSR